MKYVHNTWSEKLNELSDGVISIMEQCNKPSLPSICQFRQLHTTCNKHLSQQLPLLKQLQRSNMQTQLPSMEKTRMNYLHSTFTATNINQLQVGMRHQLKK